MILESNELEPDNGDMTDLGSSKLFFERALREAQRYGDDPWVFLRELVQNSRDAGASRIQFTTPVADGMDSVICEDDGSGMNRDHISRYLLRLYASSKESDPQSVGFFGVGFWSVLLYQPHLLRVTSVHEGRTCAFEINCLSHHIAEVLPDQNLARGTRIELFRPQNAENAVDPGLLVSERLDYYAGPLRALDGGSSPRLYCNDTQINRSFPDPGPLGCKLKTDTLEGVAGFADNPVIHLYKGGILVRDLVSLDEVIPSRPSRLPRPHRGMHPAVYLHVEGLEVLLDRRGVQENAALQEMVTDCEDALLELHQGLVHKLFPMNLKNRMHHLSSRLRPPLVAGGVLTVLLLVLGLVGWSKRPQAAAAYRPVYELPVNRALDSWSGVVIDNQQATDFRWQFSYEGPDYLLFAIKTFSIYDPIQGLISERPQNLGPFEGVDEGGDAVVTVELQIESGQQPFLLPIPEGHAPTQPFLRDGANRLTLWTNQFGDPMLIPITDGSFTYQLSLGQQAQPQVQSASLRNPPITWPEPYAGAILQARAMPAPEAINYLTDLVVGNFRYTRDPGLAALHADTRTDWLQKTLETQAGDCDVLNGLLVLMLQSAGIRAQLAAGLVGFQGRALPELHAWGRYFNNGWVSFDVTREQSLESDSPGGLPTLPASEGLQSATDRPVADFPIRATAPQPLPAREPVVISRLPFNPWWFSLLLLPLVWLLVRRRRKPDPGEANYVIGLFSQFFENGVDYDPLRLMFRPVFPLITGKRLSLHEINGLADRERLFGGKPDSPLLAVLAGKPKVLDLTSPMVAGLRPFLPVTPWLDQAEVVLEPANRTAQSLALEQMMYGLDPDFRLYTPANSDVFSELYLPLAGGPGGARHLVLGCDHVLWQKISDKLQANTPLTSFEALQLLLEGTAFYLTEKDRFLAAAAEALLQAEGVGL